MEKRYKLEGHESEIVTEYQSGQPTTLIRSSNRRNYVLYLLVVKTRWYSLLRGER